MVQYKDYDLFLKSIHPKEFTNIWISIFDNVNDKKLSSHLLKMENNSKLDMETIKKIEDEHTIKESKYHGSFVATLNSMILNVQYGNKNNSDTFLFNNDEIRISISVFDDLQRYEQVKKEESERYQNEVNRFTNDFVEAYNITKEELDFIINGQSIAFPLNYNANVKLVEEYISIRDS